MTPTHRRPTLAIISGRPGSGKTTLARAIARLLCCPLVSRDEINEGIHHTYGRDSQVASKEYVAKLAFDAFFETIRLLVSAEVSLVAEAAFQDFRWRVGLTPLLSQVDMRIVHCVVDPALAVQRVVDRRSEGTNPREARRVPPAPRPFEPLSLPVPTIHVATSDGYDPAIEAILAFITSPQPM